MTVETRRSFNAKLLNSLMAYGPIETPYSQHPFS